MSIDRLFFLSFVSIGLFSVFVNLLMLTGPLFMLQIYDRVLAVLSSVALLALALLNSARTSRLQAEAGDAASRAAHFALQLRAGAEMVRGLGMRQAALARSGALRHAALTRTVAASDRGGAYAVTSKTLRLFLQSISPGSTPIPTRRPWYVRRRRPERTK